MALVIVAFPMMAFKAIIASEVDEDSVYERTFMFDDLIPEVVRAKELEHVDHVLFLGPQSYTQHLGDLVLEHIPDITVDYQDLGE